MNTTVHLLIYLHSKQYKLFWFLIGIYLISLCNLLQFTLTIPIITGISNAVEMAMDDIRRYQRTNNFLPKVNFKEISDNCGCSVDRVLDKASAYSYQPHNKLGFLGPWCSETVESIRGKQ